MGRFRQISAAKKGDITPQVSFISEVEGVAVDLIINGLINGRIVIPNNINRSFDNVCGIGEGLKVKVNANIGTSQENSNVDLELEKLNACIEAKTDTVMDLSTAGDIQEIRKKVLERSTIPVGTVPIYENAIRAKERRISFLDVEEDEFIDVIRENMEDGVDFITVHCGVTQETIERLRKEGRITDIVSRGGSLLLEWMYRNDKENPLYTNFDKILEFANKYDVTLSLGDGLRPGSIVDGTDRAQIQELITLGELAKKAKEAEVQVMIEGPGHLPLNQIETNIKIEKELCHGAPFYVLGPLVTDIAPGYDHIVGAIGGALAAWYGADFLCYVTPSEHLRLPTVEDVVEGVIASRIAAHSADIARGRKSSIDMDLEMSRFRKKRMWDEQFNISIDPDKARKIRQSNMPKIEDECTMCGEYCSLKRTEEKI